jgi:hypothetical protein
MKKLLFILLAFINLSCEDKLYKKKFDVEFEITN